MRKFVIIILGLGSSNFFYGMERQIEMGEIWVKKKGDLGPCLVVCAKEDGTYSYTQPLRLRIGFSNYVPATIQRSTYTLWARRVLATASPKKKSRLVKVKDLVPLLKSKYYGEPVYIDAVEGEKVVLDTTFAWALKFNLEQQEKDDLPSLLMALLPTP